MKNSGCSCGGDSNFQPLLAGAAHIEETVRSPLKARGVLLAAAGALFLLAFLPHFLPQFLPVPFLSEGLFILAYILAGGRTVYDALGSLGRGFLLHENFLMSLASLGALAIGELPEAVAIMLLFNLGELLETDAVHRSRRHIAALMETKPDYANLVTAEGIEEKVNPEAVPPGEKIIIRPGEKIALDGEVISGGSFVNNAALTGEAVPLWVEAGDPVLAGAVNGSGLLQVRVSRPFGESSLARIYRLVQESAGRKAPTERFMTTFARYYTPAVVAGALLLATIPPLVIPGAAFRTWLYRALVFLVISCPCALVISIPLGYLGGIGSASKQGILVKGSNFLEALRQVKVVAFDKTGTLTEGVFRVDQVIPAPGISRSELLAWAAHAEAYSNHPIARSIREAYSGALFREEVTAYEEMGGFGVRATVRGKTVLVGSLRLLQREGIRELPDTLPGEAVYIALEDRYAGALLISDRIRPDAAAAVQQLKSLGVLRMVLLTGDHDAAAEEVARKAGVDLAYGSLLPEEKVSYLEALLDEAASAGGKLAYVGDGVNDAPALSRADIGIAMGGAGSDAAIEAADVVIMDDQLLKIATAVRIAIFTRRIVRQNIILALGVKGLFLVAGALGAASIWGALFADVGVALLAIANATRALWPVKQEGELPIGNYLPVED
ncbi:MAG: cadmium-translocating P-type ATPase [Firmicutes bacterium]|nr:cadmium-translocating P-type ATPase [Bacillota bacterium]